MTIHYENIGYKPTSPLMFKMYISIKYVYIHIHLNQHIFRYSITYIHIDTHTYSQAQLLSIGSVNLSKTCIMNQFYHRLTDINES